MKTNLFIALAAVALSTITGCVATSGEGDENLGEAEQMISPTTGGGPIMKTVTLSCSVIFTGMFQPAAKITNSSGFAVPEDADISYTVVNAYNDPGPFTGHVAGPLAKGASKTVSLTYNGSLNADHCTAKATWEL